MIFNLSNLGFECFKNANCFCCCGLAGNTAVYEVFSILQFLWDLVGSDLYGRVPGYSL